MNVLRLLYTIILLYYGGWKFFITFSNSNQYSLGYMDSHSNLSLSILFKLLIPVKNHNQHVFYWNALCFWDSGPAFSQCGIMIIPHYIFCGQINVCTCLPSHSKRKNARNQIVYCWFWYSCCLRRINLLTSPITSISNQVERLHI